MNIDWNSLEILALIPRHRVPRNDSPKVVVAKESRRKVKLPRHSPIKVYSTPLHRVPRFNKCQCGVTIGRSAKMCRICARLVVAIVLSLFIGCAAETQMPTHVAKFAPIGEKIIPTAFISAAAIAPVKPAAPPITLAWDQSADSSVAGYKLYVGNNSGIYSGNYVAGNVTSLTITGLVAGTKYFFAATAYNASGEESVFSNEISATANNDTVITIISRRAPSPTGPWTNAIIVWKATNSPLASLYVDHLIERTNLITWK